jgi:hypothetical protein
MRLSATLPTPVHSGLRGEKPLTTCLSFGTGKKNELVSMFGNRHKSCRTPDNYRYAWVDTYWSLSTGNAIENGLQTHGKQHPFIFS